MTNQARRAIPGSEDETVRMRRRIRNSTYLWLALIALGWFWLIPRASLAQDKKEEPRPPAPGLQTPKDAAKSQVPAASATKNDPTGAVTGDASAVQDAAGNSFVPQPREPDRREFRTDADFEAARKKFLEDRRALEEYQKLEPREPLTVKLAHAVGHNRVAINMMWTLLTGFLVMFMQAGFALVESGLTRAKNVAHTMAMNFLIYPLGMVGFYICGFAFMFGSYGSLGTLGGTTVLDGQLTVGNGWGILGTKGFFLSGSSYDVAVYALFFFQMVFMDTTATIPTGACAERWKFSAFVLYGFAVGTVIYPIYGNWAWGGGWCAQLGVKAGLGHGLCDFAGSSVVHLQGGIIGLVFAKLLGPRLGKYNRDGSINPVPAHNIPMVVVGTFILAFGWFGFNPGSSLAATDLRIAMVAVNTMLASAMGALAATLWAWKWFGKPDPTMMCNGLLAGLVAITAPCAFVESLGACVIGLVAGVLVVQAVIFFDRVAKIDDPVGAISVHGVNGLWGTLSVGLFADGSYGDGYNGVAGGVKGLFYGGGFQQLLAQGIGCAACIAYVVLSSIIVYKVIHALVGGHRPSSEAEVDGLDIPEMGLVGYCGIQMNKGAETPMSK
jgi:Amt family ammonium transporter